MVVVDKLKAFGVVDRMQIAEQLKSRHWLVAAGFQQLILEMQRSFKQRGAGLWQVDAEVARTSTGMLSSRRVRAGCIRQDVCMRGMELGESRRSVDPFVKLVRGWRNLEGTGQAGWRSRGLDAGLSRKSGRGGDAGDGQAGRRCSGSTAWNTSTSTRSAP